MSEEAQVESAASAEPTEAVQTETAVERPEWLPEKFGSAEDLANAYSSLESKLGQKEEDYRTAFMEEIEKEAYANRPETVGDYSYNWPYDYFSLVELVKIDETVRYVSDDLTEDPDRQG